MYFHKIYSFDGHISWRKVCVCGGYGVRTFLCFQEKKKGKYLTQSYIPFTNRNVKMAKWQHKQRHKKVILQSGTKKFDYRAVADRLRTVSWSNWCQIAVFRVSGLIRLFKSRKYSQIWFSLEKGKWRSYVITSLIACVAHFTGHEIFLIIQRLQS